MYGFLLTIQYLGIIFLVLAILYIVKQPNSHMQSLMLLLCIFVLINTLGYSLEMQARNADVALSAVKIAYLGKPYITLTMLMVMLDFFDIKLHTIIKYILLGLHIAVSLLVFTSDINRWYYTTIDFTENGLFPHLVLGHSIIYICFTALLFTYALIMIFLPLYTKKKIFTRNERYQVCIFYIIVSLCVVALVLYLLNLTAGYDTTSIAYLISTVLLTIAMTKFDLLDPVIIAKDEVLNQMTDGLIITNTEGKVLYQNKIAATIFEELIKNNAFNKHTSCIVLDNINNNHNP